MPLDPKIMQTPLSPKALLKLIEKLDQQLQNYKYELAEVKPQLIMQSISLLRKSYFKRI